MLKQRTFVVIFSINDNYVSTFVTANEMDGADGMVAPQLARRWMRVLTAHICHTGGFVRRPNAKAPGLCGVGNFLPATANHSYHPLF